MHQLGKTKVDMWYNHPFIKKVYFADAFFSDCDCVYRGNIYDENGKVVGDYTTTDSVWIENSFKVKFA